MMDGPAPEFVNDVRQAVAKVTNYLPDAAANLENELDSLQSIELLIHLEDVTRLPLEARDIYGPPPVTPETIAQRLQALASVDTAGEE